MAKLTFDRRGIKVLSANLEKANIITTRAGAQKLRDIATNIMSESAVEVPRDSETLANSGYIEGPTHKEGSVKVSLGYGGTNDQVNPKTGKRASDYMVAVHERIDAKHPIGKAKFLEDPVMRNAEHVGPELGEALTNILKRTFRR